jgi:HSP20 family protein
MNTVENLKYPYQGWSRRMARYKDSFEELLGFSRSMDRMLSSLLLQDNAQTPSMWRPPTDVYETQDAVVILVEIAGMDPDKIQVEFSDRTLRVSGKRPDKHRRAVAHCLEVQYGDFSSEVYLPGQYNLDAISAEYKDGFLTIVLPKLQPATHVISVQSKTARDGFDT